MRFQLLKLILWSTDTTNEPRVISFKPGVLNVITGASRTGKSAIIPIIDYCLASSACSIPVDIIRDSCAWFGVVVQLENEELLLARESPEKNTSSTKMFRLRGKDLQIPRIINESNASVSQIKLLLNGVAGIPSLGLDASDDGRGFFEPASVRDLISFNFQPQNVVANQNVLFYKVESYKYRERLKNVFPFALGIITAEILSKQHELNNVRRILLQKEREYARIKQVSARWVAELKTNVFRAVEYGIWPDEADAQSTDVDYLISILRNISDAPAIEVAVTEKTIDKTTQTLRELKVEEHDLSMQLMEQRNSKSELDRLQRTLAHHSDITSLKRDRLKISEWLLSTEAETKSCPVCGNLVDHDSSELEDLCYALHQFELDAKAAVEMPSAFYREVKNINDDIRQRTEKLNSIQKQIQVLEVTTEKRNKERYIRDEALKFIGSLENSLNTFKEVQEDGGLQEEIQRLLVEVAKLENEVSEHQIAKRKKVVLRKLSTTIASLLPNLDIEKRYVKAPCELSIQDLSLKISLDNGVQHFLSEIGSGSNWVAYHVALTVALHRYFSEEPRNPVPSFIVYDQPSQVYFPRRLADEGKEVKTTDTPEIDRAEAFTDEDVEAVRKIFKVIADSIGIDEGRWQGLVLDHAPKSVWNSIPNVHMVAEWRDGEKLVPHNWYVAQ